MKKFLAGILGLGFYLLLACGDTPTKPDPPVHCGENEQRLGNECVCIDGYEKDAGGICVKKAPEKPPRVDQPFSWDNYWGFSAFGLLAWHETDIPIESTNTVLVYLQMQSNGFNTGRICAETEFWDGSAYRPRQVRDLEKLDSMLDTIARIPNAQVLLMSNCTLKHSSPMIPFSIQREWNLEVAKTAAKYQNVAIEVVNEYWHPTHQYRDQEDLVKAYIRDARSVGVLEVGADDHICRIENKRHTLFSTVTFPSFHVCRDDRGEPWDPNRAWLQDLVGDNGGLAVITETVAYNDPGDQCDHFLRTCDKNRIISYKNRCKNVGGCRWTLHSDDGLRALYPYSWVPVW